MLTLSSPTICRFSDDYQETIKLKQLKMFLKCIDKKKDYEIKRLKRNSQWYVKDQASQEDYEQLLEKLKSERERSLLFEDDNGLYTYSGLAHDLSMQFQDQVKIQYELPDTGNLPYLNQPHKLARPYQNEAFEKLIEKVQFGPVSVSIATGLGKTFIINKLIKHYGLKTLVVTPSVSIAEQIYEELVHLFGKKYVGKYFAGKKQPEKLIAVGVGASLTKVEPGTKDSEEFAKVRLLLGDEAHSLTAETFAKVVLEVAPNAPYRLFFTATHLRNDGLDLVLDGITGPVVYEMTPAQGIEAGYLAKPIFKMINVSSHSEFKRDDPNEMTRKHLYYNTRVNQIVGNYANLSVSDKKRPVLILIEEIEQFSKILPHLKHQVAFAHAPLTPENKKYVPKEYQDSDNEQLVKDFNEGKIPILVGTSCIATGTDIQSVGALVYLMGKSSEIKVKQALGRATRGGANCNFINPWTGVKKLDCHVLDFDIKDIPVVSRHSQIRRGYYEEYSDTINEVDFM